MKAVCWWGKEDVRVVDVPDPKIINPNDAIVRVTLTAICGSDLHLFGGFVPTMMRGDILGHEFMGEVVEVGPGVKKLKTGDRIIVPFPIACGSCWFCTQGLTSLCDNTNPNAWMNEALMGYATAGIFGYSHMYGGYAGGQAQYVRVPYADTNHQKIPNGVADEQALFLTDIFPTGYMAAEACDIQPGDTVAVWGCGPVGLFAIRSAWLLGAERVIAIDRFRERLGLAAADGKTEVLDYGELDDVYEQLKDMTGGRGPDRCIDAVGMEAHGTFIDAIVDKIKQAVKLQFDRAHALRQALHCCRKGGTVSIPGVYAGFIDKVPFGTAFGKGLTLKMGQTHVHRYTQPLLERVQRGEIDPTFIISHRVSLDEAPEMYRTFRAKQDECIKVVMTTA
ncbi:MAG TPA: zinc-dependent alcohol dehydrogenase [Thermoanaerobaculia bacterium]|jgi:threonine dehydrogenase-like Zn-dependent dehydrogenase